VRPWQPRLGCFAGRDGRSRGGGGRQREALVRPAHALAAERARLRAAAVVVREKRARHDEVARLAISSTREQCRARALDGRSTGAGIERAAQLRHHGAGLLRQVGRAASEDARAASVATARSRMSPPPPAGELSSTTTMEAATAAEGAGSADSASAAAI
jgi:hypothetical protein